MTFAIHSTAGEKPENMQDHNICTFENDLKKKKIIYCVYNFTVFEMRNFPQWISENYLRLFISKIH